MKVSRFIGFCIAGLVVAAAHAQEKPRKTMTFPPGATTPAEASAAPAPAPAPGSARGGYDLTSAEAPAHIAGGFFGLLQRGEVDKAYEELTRGSKIAERPEDLKTLKTKTREAIEVFGSISGYELVDAKNVGTRLLRRTYLSLGRDFPLRWRFYFYKSENIWRLIDLRVDDRLAGMFDEVDEPRTALESK
jgi:hypothetical protein